MIGHSLIVGAAREWRLYISTSRDTTSVGIEEPALFSAAGSFVRLCDGSQGAWVECGLRLAPMDQRLHATGRRNVKEYVVHRLLADIPRGDPSHILGESSP